MFGLKHGLELRVENLVISSHIAFKYTFTIWFEVTVHGFTVGSRLKVSGHSAAPQGSRE